MFNVFLGGSRTLLKDAMSELFHNVSWQALSNSYDKVKIKFSLVTVLAKDINCMLEKN